MPYIESGPSSFILESGPPSLQVSQKGQKVPKRSGIKLEMCQFSESGTPSRGSQHGMKFAYSALEGALPAIVDEVSECHFVN